MVSEGSLSLDNQSANQWKSEVLEIVFEALANSDKLVDCIVFKGARILSKRLNSFNRQSLDIDANLLLNFVSEHPEFSTQKDFLEKEIALAIKNHFENQNPVRFELDRIKIALNPPTKHPMGWNAFTVTVSVSDLENSGVRGLPNLKIDLAAPEELGDGSISTIDIGAHKVHAYTLERIAGEKLRAFLSSLPAYRKKVSKPGDAVRVKDIYDISRIVNHNPLSDSSFWKKAGEEFQRSCKSRYIDCYSVETFEEGLDLTEKLFIGDPTLPKDISFDEAWRSLHEIVAYFIELEIVPFEYPLP